MTKTTLLNIDANAKTVKGIKHGFSTAVLYLAPYIVSGHQMCPFAEDAGCWRTCLNTAGRGGMPTDGFFNANGVNLPDNAIQRARIRRTKFWKEDPIGFISQLVDEIEHFVARAKRKGLTPIVRLNGTSDIRWEDVALPTHLWPAPEADVPWPWTIFDRFPDVQFYDYTKIPKRIREQAENVNWPKNYYLCLSYSEASPKYAARCWNAHDRWGASLVMVARNPGVKQQLLEAHQPSMDGDDHDMRFLDAPGAFIILKAKGSARREDNGFVLDGPAQRP